MHSARSPSGNPIRLFRKFSSMFGSEAGVDVDPTGHTHYSSPDQANTFESLFPVDRITDRLKEQFLRLDYKVTDIIGKGGMGAVFEAHYIGANDTLGTKPGSRVAIKVISDSLVTKDDQRTRFFREATLSRQLQHPGVVKVFEVGELCKRPFFVMEYLEGQELSFIIDEKRDKGERLDVGRALQIARDVASALGAAHSKGIIHRDVKPDNIFIVMEDGEEKVKIIDLGVAKVVNANANGAPRLTNEAVIMGTPTYIAPETIQDAGEPVNYDHRIDIYSLGITLYEMLCGNVPFESTSALGTFYSHKTEAPKPLREIIPDIPEAVDRLVLRCLEKDPDNRFQTMEELIDAIGECGVKPETPTLLSASPGYVQAARKSADSMEITALYEPKEISRPRRPGIRRTVEPVEMVPAMRPKKKSGAARLAAAAIVAGGIASAGLMLSREPEEHSNVIPKPSASTDVKPRKRTNEVYNAQFETNISGTKVMKEEKLADGTIVERELGKTPLDIPLKGEQMVFLEMEGYQRVYLKVSPENSFINYRMKKRK